VFVAAAIVLGALLGVAGIKLVWTIIDRTRDLAKAVAIAAGREFPLLDPEMGAPD
jgi:hypothetical protein